MDLIEDTGIGITPGGRKSYSLYHGAASVSCTWAWDYPCERYCSPAAATCKWRGRPAAAYDLLPVAI
jgi:hypothetical protein